MRSSKCRLSLYFSNNVKKLLSFFTRRHAVDIVLPDLNSEQTILPFARFSIHQYTKSAQHVLQHYGIEETIFMCPFGNRRMCAPYLMLRAFCEGHLYKRKSSSSFVNITVQCSTNIMRMTPESSRSINNLK